LGATRHYSESFRVAPEKARRKRRKVRHILVVGVYFPCRCEMRLMAGPNLTGAIPRTRHFDRHFDRNTLGEVTMKATVQKATNLVVLSARIYRELALSAFSLVRQRP
jgi:hypothetical protein